jgi:biotin operon repressor
VKRANKNSIQAVVLPLADGTRSIPEIAKIAGATCKRVEWALHALRAAGHKARVAKTGGRPLSDDPKAAQIRNPHNVLQSIERGETYAAIGRRIGISRQAVHEFALRHRAKG